MGSSQAVSSLLLHVGTHEELVREARVALESNGHDVSVAAVDSVEAAAEYGDEHGADCVVYDRGATDGERWTMADLADRASGRPWLLLTGDETDVNPALRAGAADVLVRRAAVDDATLLARRLEGVLGERRPHHDEGDGSDYVTELRREREFTDLLLDTLDDVFYLVGPDGTLERWNESLKSVTGYTDEELAGMAALDLFEGADRQRVEEAITGALETGGAGVEADFVTKAGTEIPYEFTGARLTDQDGELRGLVGIGRDLSERKELERELRRKASLLDHIFNQVPTALYVKDTEGRHLRMSEYHSNPDETIGKTDPEIYGETEYTKSTYADDMRVIEEGDRIINEEEYNPVADEWILTSKVPWRDEDGDVQGLIGVSRFITEKKEYERELRVRNRAMAEAPIGITIHDAAAPDQLVYTNTAFESLTGYDQQTIGGDGFAALCGAETDRDAFETIESAFEEGHSTGLTLLLYRADGTPFWGRIGVAPVTDDDGGVTHFVGFLQDVTESEEHAHEVERRLDEFGDLIAEELRTPLENAEEAVEALDEDGTDPQVEAALRSVRRVDKLIDDLATVHSFSVKSRDVFGTDGTTLEGDE